MSDLQSLLERLEGAWLPIVFCPTDGVDRALMLPDGREVVGAFHNPGGWRVCSVVEYEKTVYERPVRGGVLPMVLKPRPPEPKPIEIGKRMAQMRVYGALPENVYPVLFRPNDTVYGVASLQALIASKSPSEPSA